MLDDKRCGPRIDLRPVHAPDFLTGQFVERHDERLSLMVPHDDQAIPIQRRSASLSELVAHSLVAEIFLPNRLAVHVVGIHAARLEPCVDVLAVRYRRTRSPGAVVLMRGLVRLLLLRDPFPNRLAGRAVDRQHDESVHVARLHAAFGAWRVFAGGTCVGTAVSTKTRSPQTTGDADPRPGISTFQRMFFVSLHSRGGLAVGDTPVANGPRHCAQ